MPFVSQTTLVGLITHARNSSAPLIQPRLVSALAPAVKPLERGHGHPIGIHNRLFSEVRASVGDNGARRLIQQRAEQIDCFDCDDVGVIQDIDHPSDLPAENQ
jgi:CTP:molybdopterin cytidylyltransferase MocA